jgi:hypothetical protein
MTYDIEIQRPVRFRRGDLKVIVVVVDSQGKEIFRDRVGINEEKTRTRIAERIASITGDAADRIAARLLDKLAQIPPHRQATELPLLGKWHHTPMSRLQAAFSGTERPQRASSPPP